MHVENWIEIFSTYYIGSCTERIITGHMQSYSLYSIITVHDTIRAGGVQMYLS